ncbi:MAG: helix-turn-helix transcriptional regulator [Treponema sp.]|nr:helix-turn-helix transcriptional regulator [Treponema sp.]
MSVITASKSMTVCKTDGQVNETAVKSSVLTAREQEVLNLLLTGLIPKEIAAALNISYATVLDHQKNLYRKLEIHNINEMFVKFGSAKNETIQTEKKETPVQGTEAREANPLRSIFGRWDTFEDNFGSYVNYTQKIELIQDNYTETHSISGNMSNKGMAYAGVNAYPDPSTLELMKKAKRFSFMVLGDGNSYEVKIATSETRKDADYNHYAKIFSTKNGLISEININIDELTPTYTIKTAPFNQNSIETFIIQTFSKGDFNLKFWNIEFHL